MANHASNTATSTPISTRSEVLKRLSQNAEILGAYLSVIEHIEPDHQNSALANCASMAEELAQDVAAFVEVTV